MATNDDAVCIHCDSALTPRDLADGWCDSCGKRLPTAIRPKAIAKGTVAAARTGRGKRWAMAIVGIAMALVGAAAAYAVAG
jgi:hypothetical protein